MRVFRVVGPGYRSDAVLYQSLQVVNGADWHQYGFRDGARVFGYFDGRPAPWPWSAVDLRVRVRDDWGDRAPADLLAFRAGLIGLRQAASDELGSILGDGELLPATIDHAEEIWLFHCRNPLAAFDVDSSTVSIPAGQTPSPEHVKQWAFQSAVIGESAFFRDPTFGSALFATDRAQAVIESAGFVGVDLIEIWNDVGEQPPASHHPWTGITFASIAEIIAHEATEPLPAETFDETLFSLLAAHYPLGNPLGPADPVNTYFAQRVIQYRVITGGIHDAIAAPHLITFAASRYRAWGRPDAAAALEEAQQLVPALIQSVDRGEPISFDDALHAIKQRRDEDPLVDERLREIERSVSHESWSANPERLEHVRQHRKDFLAKSAPNPSA